VISVSDTGSGISKKQLPHILDRFYQVNDSYIKDGDGTGIGLALTKELVQLHHGIIEVESNVGVGTTFRVYLPLGSEHLAPEEIETSPQSAPETRWSTVDNETTEPASQYLQPATSNDSPIILIVEDNLDLRQYIRSYLDQTYNVIEAENGQQGLEKSIEHIPDLVISDVMMPLMDGYELCHKLKIDERTSHIPVILLTARASIESKLEGLETGADDFITKPFDTDELQVRVKNLIEQRYKLRERFSKKLTSPGSYILQLHDELITSMDQKFIQKAISVVEKNMKDFDFGVEAFSNEMAMSRMQLHRKLKAIVNQSASVFIRNIRLRKAAALLSKKSETVTEIAFEVGFNNLSWFTKCFHDQYGVSPSEYPG